MSQYITPDGVFQMNDGGTTNKPTTKSSYRAKLIKKIKENAASKLHTEEEKQQLLSMLTLSVDIIQNPEKYRSDFKSQ